MHAHILIRTCTHAYTHACITHNTYTGTQTHIQIYAHTHVNVLTYTYAHIHNIPSYGVSNAALSIVYAPNPACRGVLRSCLQPRRIKQKLLHH